MPDARAPFFVSALIMGLGLSLTPASAEKPVLTVYTYSSFSGEYGPGGKIEAAFEKTCGCDLVFTGLDDTGAMLARLKLEGADAKADVMLGLDSTQMPEARSFMAPHGQSAEGLTMPTPWTDSEFLPFDWGHIAMVYDADRLASPPDSLRALVENENGPRIIVQDPRVSAPGFGFLLWIRTVFGDEAPAAWEKLRPRIVTFAKGWSEAYDLFLKGEADMVVSYTTSPAYHISAEGKTNYKAAIFAEGHYLQIETMGVTKSARHPELARRFVAFMLSEEAQGLIPEGNFMLPARLDAARLPASFKALPLPAKALVLPPEEVEAKRRAFLDEWLAATTR
jgi:thiamine transport system substrate-binding protein